MDEEQIKNSTNVVRLRRKRDQAYELAGLAHRDGDTKDAALQTKLAKLIEARLEELYNG